MDQCKQKIQESNHSGTMSEINVRESAKKEAESKDEMKKIHTSEHVLCHCRTKCDVKETTFVWSIANFWDIYNKFDTLTSSEVENLFFKINMCIDKKNLKLTFFICDPKDQIKDKINKCNIYIQDSKGKVLNNSEIFCLNDALYEISIETFRQNESIYLFNNTLSVCFVFESYDKILHSTLMMCTSNSIVIPNITIPEITNNNSKNSKNDFTSNDPLQDGFVTFLVEGKYFHVKRKLCENIPYLNDLVKKTLDKKEKLKIVAIDTVTHDIFQLIILYLETNNLFGLKSHESDDSNYINKLRHLLQAADIYDIKKLKCFCEQRLIECTKQENVLRHLAIAINYNAWALESFTKKFIKLYLDDIVNTIEFQELIRNNPKILLSDILEQELHEENVLNTKSRCNVCQISHKN